MSDWSLDDEKKAAMADGVHTLHAMSNVARGTRGYALNALVEEGKMRCDRKEFGQFGPSYTYTPVSDD